MSIRNLDSLFDPSCVAVIGASHRPGRVGTTVWRNLRSSGFAGPVLAVNPKYKELDGQPVAAHVRDLPQTPELAVICTPPDGVAELIAELGAMGTKAAVLLTAGLTKAQKDAIRAAAKPHLLRILGPNCIGMLSPHLGLNASFAHISAQPGEIAFVSQSGALTTALLDWAASKNIGFSHFVSLGEKLDVDFGDMLDYLASDPKTRAILLYIESVNAPRKFMSAARAAARNKPVIVVKAGRSDVGQKAAASHTGALAGADHVYDAAIARAGMLRVDTVQQLFMAVETLARFRGNTADALTILTNGGGAGVMAADAADNAGVELAELAPETITKLDAVLPGTWSRGNPIDIIGDAPVDRYVKALEVLATDPAAGAVLLLHAPTAIVPSNEIAQALLPLAQHQPPRLMGCWLGEQAVRAARQTFQQGNIASYFTPEQAVRAFGFGVTYRRNQAQLMEAPPAARAQVSVDRELVQGVVRQVLAEGRELLTEAEAKQVLAAYGVPVVGTRTVPAVPQTAAEAAQAMGFPVVLKILSKDITHKSDMGGVVLDLESAEDVANAARAMLERVRRARPDAQVDGFTVQAMVRRPLAQELIVGASIDPVFGPIILFGHGGTAVEVIGDRAVALPPLSEPLARALVQRTRVAKLLAGYRGIPAADLQGVYSVLQAVSQLLADVPELAELDINPLVADAEGVLALDGRIRVKATAPGGAAKFAIEPYPAHLVETITWQGQSLSLRPIRPEDEAQHLAFLEKLDPEDIRMRVFYSRRSIERTELARLTQIDYAREMAFVAVAADPADPSGREQTLGVVRAISDPDNIAAEYGIIIRSDLKGGGLGRILMEKMVRYAREHGTQRLEGLVIAENRAMLELCRELGFEELEHAVGAEHRQVVLKLH